MKYGVIGTGWICKAWIEAARTLPDFRLEAVCSRTEARGSAFLEELGGAAGIAVYKDPARMAEMDLDAVYIASPNGLHAAQTEIFLKAGKHVLCEKPAALYEREHEALFGLAESKNLIYTEAVIPRLARGREPLRRAVSRLGGILSARMDFSQYSSRLELLRAGSLPNVFDPAMGGGALMDVGIYCVSLTLDLFGMPEQIDACARLLPSGTDGSGTAIFHYTAFDAVLTWSKTGQSRIGSEILGEKGTLSIDFLPLLRGIRFSAPDEKSQTEFAGEVPRLESMADETRRFEAFIRDPRDTRQDYLESCALSRDTLRVMEQIRELAGIHLG